MNEEKDRFGEFIRLLERAREDVYFAEKDRELLEKLKQHLADPIAVESVQLRCPQCSLVLGDASFLSVPVHRCPGCGGMWVARGCVFRLLKTTRPESAGAS